MRTGICRTRWGAGIAVFVAALLVASDPSPWAAASTAAGAPRPSTTSTVYDHLALLAGSPSTLVYARYHQLASSAAGFRTPEPALNRSTAQLIVRSSDGTSKSLGAVPVSAGQWSLVGHVLTAVPEKGSGRPSRSVDWWNTVSGAHGQITLSKGDRYQSAGPGGVIYAHAGVTLRLHLLHGRTTTLGTPFSPADSQLRVTAGPQGLVAVGSTGKAKYLGYEHPGTFTPLSTGTSSSLLCSTVTTAYAACAAGEYDDGSLVADSMILLPLDGSASTTTVTCPGLPVTAVGDTLFWGSSCAGPTTLSSQRAGEAVPTTSTTRIGPGLVSAYGKATALTHTKTSAITAPTATSFSTLIRPRRSPVSVAGFALTAGRILYVDDVHNATRPSALTTAHLRQISPTQHPPVGKSHVVGAGSGSVQVDPLLVAMSSKALVYGLTRYGNSSPYADLRVVTPARSVTVEKVVSYGNISLSGNRLLFQRQTAKGSTTNLFNIATGTTRILRRFSPLNTTSTAVSGHHIAVATRQGGVYREDLRTGQRVTLAPADRSYHGTTSVYIHGNWVGWHLQDQHGRSRDYLRNAKTKSKTIRLPRALWSLTSDGALLDRSETSTQPAGNTGAVGGATSFSLRSYQGTTHTLLSKRQFVTGPQLVGRTLAWVDAAGVLRAKVVNGL